MKNPHEYGTIHSDEHKKTYFFLVEHNKPISIMWHQQNVFLKTVLVLFLDEWLLWLFESYCHQRMKALERPIWNTKNPRCNYRIFFEEAHRTTVACIVGRLNIFWHFFQNCNSILFFSCLIEHQGHKLVMHCLYCLVLRPPSLRATPVCH